MILQRTFRKNYVDTLLEAVKHGENLDLYGKESFEFDKEQVVMIPSLPHPEGLLKKMIPTTQGDFKTAVALYEAFPDLTPLQASDRNFWIYLAHVDLFPYVQQRFFKVLEPGFSNKQYILDHWFFAQGTVMQALSGLWWLTHLSVDEEGESKYKYTEQIFRDYSMRTNFANYTFARHKEAIIGYLQFVIDNPEIFRNFFKARNRFITKHFNKIGGSRLISTLPRDYFYEELEKIKNQIYSINSSSKQDKEEEKKEIELFG